MAGIEASRRVYFVAKCVNMDSLKRSAKNNIWACCDRKTPPQPKDAIENALAEGQDVLLLFSVNNCHGWHGCAKLTSAPGSVSLEEFLSASDSSDIDLQVKDGEGKSLEWHRFRMEWQLLFLREHGEQCLPFSETQGLSCSDGSALNKARNFQQVSSEVGAVVVEKMERFHTSLTKKVQQKLEQQKEKLPAPFFQPGPDNDPQVVWEKLVHKVASMGKVLLACAFGSQRYNLNTPESDVDMFIVYSANTRDVLGFHPPQQTIKNKDTEICDYTVHEVYRYCELLMSGDPRCVETLHLHPSSIYCSSPEWEQLCEHKHRFLTRQCAEKYLRDAMGSKGIKYLDKLTDSKEALQVPMTKKVAKLFYIIFRLLQNARDVLQGYLNVYRADDSPEKQFLMEVRASGHSYESLREKLDTLLHEIDSLKVNYLEKDPAVETVTEAWLMELRYHNFEKHMNDPSSS